MDQLWAPWRMAYVKKESAVKPGCFICHTLAENDDRAHLIVQRTPLSVVHINRFPYNSGHLLISPQAHKGRLDELTAEESVDLQQQIGEMIGRLEKIMKPEGFNVGLNMGAAAGAGLPGHLHWHIVPRWNGDTNFMPILTDTKVLVQALDALYDALTQPLK